MGRPKKDNTCRLNKVSKETENKLNELRKIMSEYYGVQFDNSQIIEFIVNKEHRAITLEDNDPTGEKECTCPNCGAEVEFGEERFEDTQAVIAFKCPKCKTHGDKWYTLLYDRTVEYTVRSEQTAI